MHLVAVFKGHVDTVAVNQIHHTTTKQGLHTSLFTGSGQTAAILVNVTVEITFGKEAADEIAVNGGL